MGVSWCVHLSAFSLSLLVELRLLVLCRPVSQQQDVRRASLFLKHFIQILPAEKTQRASCRPDTFTAHWLSSHLEPFYKLSFLAS